MGLTHLYYGDGKGKTTAALGLALRAAGQGLRVVIAQFLKPLPSGEQRSLERLSGVTFIRPSGSGKFTFEMSESEKRDAKRLQDEAFSHALSLVRDGECDLLILDEALDAYSLGLLDKTLLEDLVNNKPPELELVVTGHEPEDFILQRADYITEMVSRRHPYDSGVAARRGVEF